MADGEVTAHRFVTEFSPSQIEQSGCSPRDYLQKLADCGFKFQLVGEEDAPPRPAGIDDIMVVCRGQGIANLLCER